MSTQLERNTLVAGLDSLFKTVELKLPCVIAVRDFTVHRVVKQLAIAIGIRFKWWQDGKNCYTVLFRDRITGREISRLICDFECAE